MTPLATFFVILGFLIVCGYMQHLKSRLDIQSKLIGGLQANMRSVESLRESLGMVNGSVTTLFGMAKDAIKRRAIRKAPYKVGQTVRFINRNSGGVKVHAINTGIITSIEVEVGQYWDCKQGYGILGEPQLTYKITPTCTTKEVLVRSGDILGVSQYASSVVPPSDGKIPPTYLPLCQYDGFHQVVCKGRRFGQTEAYRKAQENITAMRECRFYQPSPYPYKSRWYEDPLIKKRWDEFLNPPPIMHSWTEEDAERVRKATSNSYSPNKYESMPTTALVIEKSKIELELSKRKVDELVKESAKSKS